jgi:hypothetical protein
MQAMCQLDAAVAINPDTKAIVEVREKYAAVISVTVT